MDGWMVRQMERWRGIEKGEWTHGSWSIQVSVSLPANLLSRMPSCGAREMMAQQRRALGALSSHHSYGNSQPLVTSGTGDTMSSSGLWDTGHTHSAYRDMQAKHIHQIKINWECLVAISEYSETSFLSCSDYPEVLANSSDSMSVCPTRGVISHHTPKTPTKRALKCLRRHKADSPSPSCGHLDYCSCGPSYAFNSGNGSFSLLSCIFLSPQGSCSPESGFSFSSHAFVGPSHLGANACYLSI